MFIRCSSGQVISLLNHTINFSPISVKFCGKSETFCKTVIHAKNRIESQVTEKYLFTKIYIALKWSSGHDEWNLSILAEIILSNFRNFFIKSEIFHVCFQKMFTQPNFLSKSVLFPKNFSGHRSQFWQTCQKYLPKFQKNSCTNSETNTKIKFYRNFSKIKMLLQTRRKLFRQHWQNVFAAFR